MIFNKLSEKLQAAFQKLKSKGKLTEKDVKMVLKEVKIALLEADVNFKVVKEFVSKIEEKATGEEILKSLTPGQQVIKIVHEELTHLMGKEKSELIQGREFTTIMLVGLQGSGKTTTTAKLAHHLKGSGHHPFMVAADIYRPAAIDQLKKLGEKIDVPVFSLGTNTSPLNICRAGQKAAVKEGKNLLLLDTAGRLHIDAEMMAELLEIKEVLQPDEVLLIADAMTGQDAVNLAQKFNDDLGITGVILTKLEGDARGGAALSIRAVTGAPIKFVGVGEKVNELEPFHPERLASRILGMGDVMTLIEKAESSYDKEQALALEKKIREDSFSLEDFLEQLKQVRSMGSFEELISMVPGMNKKALGNIKVDEKQLDRIEAIINSMTKEERINPDIIDGSRRQRVARGSGTSPQEVNRLMKQYRETRKLFKSFRKGKMPFFPGNIPVR